MSAKKNIDKMFPGMKKQPAVGRPKGYRKKYEPLTYKGKLKFSLSDYQKRTNSEFMKVREGETIEQWKKRTVHRRVRDVDEIKELALMNPLRVNLRSRERNAEQIRNKFIIVQPIEREFDFMRYYGIVINYYSIKYGIKVEDMQLGFYFFTNIPFTKDRFENAAVLHLGTMRKKLTEFLSKGYIEEVLNNQRHYGKENTHDKTHLFKLTKDFSKRLTFIYRTLGRMNGIRINQTTLTGLDPEVKQIIMDMNDEIQEIQTGRKPQDKIK